jgi:hypothetical protein
MSDLDEIITAYHEGGHLVGYVAQGHTDLIGVATLRPPNVHSLAGRRSILAAATNCLAGPAAEASYRRVAIAEVLAEGGKSDLAMAERHLGLYAEPSPERDEAVQYFGHIPEIEDVCRRAERIVSRHWDMVRVLAVALIRHRRLDQASVRMLLDPRGADPLLIEAGDRALRGSR